MSEDTTKDRPSQVTLAGWFTVVAAGLVVVSCFESITNLQTVDVRDGISDYLKTPIGKGLGMSISEVQSLMRVALMASASAAVAAMVLGLHVLKRNKAARIALSVIAVLLVITAPAAGGILAVFVACSTAMLWTGPARDWFAGRPVRPPRMPPYTRDIPPLPPHDLTGTSMSSQPPVGPEETPQPVPVPVQPSTTPSGEVPPPTYGFGSPGAAPAQPQQPPAYPQGAPQEQQAPPPWMQSYGPNYGHAQPSPDQRPTAVTVAAWLTWAFGALALLGGLVLVAVLVGNEQVILDEAAKSDQFKEAGLDGDVLVTAMWVGSVIFIGLAAAAMVFAVFMFRRHNWGRIALTVTAVIALLFSVASFPVSLIHLGAIVASLVLMYRGTSNAWFRGSSYAGPGVGPPQQWQQQPPQQPGGQPPLW